MEYQFPGVGYNRQTCNRVSLAAGYPFYALQYGGECWATRNLTFAFGYGPSDQCTINCIDEVQSFPGNCGGVLANALHKTCVPSHSYTYRGCYTDGCERTPDQPIRRMTYQFPGNNYDISSCYQVALASGYSIFALQYGGECWASDSLTTTTSYGLSDQCNMFCRNQTVPFPGNCGGVLANAVYTIDDFLPLVPTVTSTPQITSTPPPSLSTAVTSNEQPMLPKCNVTNNYIGKKTS